MPVSAQAALVTDVYRRSLSQQRDTTADAVAGLLVGVDFDLPRRQLGRTLDRFNLQAANLVAAGVDRAAELSDLYVDTYLIASGLAPDGSEFAPHTEPEHHSIVTDHVVPALLWRLASHAGRAAAMGYAAAVARRTTRTAIGDTARNRVHARIQAESAVAGWRRVTGPSTCDVCARGAGRLYPDAEALVCHPACRCSAEPVLRELPETVQRKAPTIVTPPRARAKVPGLTQTNLAGWS